MPGKHDETYVSGGFRSLSVCGVPPEQDPHTNQSTGAKPCFRIVFAALQSPVELVCAGATRQRGVTASPVTARWVVRRLIQRAMVENFERWREQVAEDKEMKAKALRVVRGLIQRTMVEGFERCTFRKFFVHLTVAICTSPGRRLAWNRTDWFAANKAKHSVINLKIISCNQTTLNCDVMKYVVFVI